MISVDVNGASTTLNADQEFTFGRDPSCDACLDQDDRGISRLAGSISCEGGLWYIVNRSRKRPLHVLDATGFALPLPVGAPGWPPGRRSVDQAELTVLVPGECWTHTIVVRAEQTAALADPLGSRPPTRDPRSTYMPILRLTPRRRAALAALARDYLRPPPHYRPSPLTYRQVATMLNLREAQVRKRIECVRHQLVDVGVAGLDNELDARRQLCEWLLATRTITKGDLDVLPAST